MTVGRSEFVWHFPQHTLTHISQSSSSLTVLVTWQNVNGGQQQRQLHYIQWKDAEMSDLLYIAISLVAAVRDNCR